MYLGLTKNKQLLYDFMLRDSNYYYFNDAMLNASVQTQLNSVKKEMESTSAAITKANVAIKTAQR